MSYFSCYQTIIHAKYTFTNQAIFCSDSTTHAFGTRKRTPPQPRYLVFENYDILYLYGCTFNFTDYHLIDVDTQW